MTRSCYLIQIARKKFVKSSLTERSLTAECYVINLVYLKHKIYMLLLGHYSRPASDIQSLKTLVVEYTEFGLLFPQNEDKM